MQVKWQDLAEKQNTFASRRRVVVWAILMGTLRETTHGQYHQHSSNINGVSMNGGTPESSILMGCSLINPSFWGTPIYGTPHISILEVLKGNTKAKSLKELESVTMGIDLYRFGMIWRVLLNCYYVCLPL